MNLNEIKNNFFHYRNRLESHLSLNAQSEPLFHSAVGTNTPRGRAERPPLHQWNQSCLGHHRVVRPDQRETDTHEIRSRRCVDDDNDDDDRLTHTQIHRSLILTHI